MYLERIIFFKKNERQISRDSNDEKIKVGYNFRFSSYWKCLINKF